MHLIYLERVKRIQLNSTQRKKKKEKILKFDLFSLILFHPFMIREEVKKKLFFENVGKDQFFFFVCFFFFDFFVGKKKKI